MDYDISRREKTIVQYLQLEECGIVVKVSFLLKKCVILLNFYTLLFMISVSGSFSNVTMQSFYD